MKIATDFKEKHAFVFGGGTGIGAAIAAEFVQRGCQVTIADIDLEAATKTANKIINDGGNTFATQCDVTNEQSMMLAVQEAEGRFSDIDIVVNNVGVIISGNPEDIPLSEWQRVFDLNFMSMIRSNHIFLPKFLSRGVGSIVNTASFAGLFPYASNRMPYAAAKAAVVSLSQSLALYLLPNGISVSCFCPGPVNTNVKKGMRSWSESAVMSGPGSQFELIEPLDAAKKLADGMQAGHVLIPTHDEVFSLLQTFTLNPDDFICQKITDINSGDLGLPTRSKPATNV